jgi:prepilin-type N-terminal cleavage/methylation domain-containing protein
MNRKGITLIELLIALAILSMAMSGFTYLVVSNMRYNASSGLKTQGAQILNYLGRRAVSGDAPVVPDTLATKSWNYAQLSSAFPDLAKSANLANTDQYRASVSDLGVWSNADATVSLQRYRVMVCWRSTASGAGEECVRGNTLGPKALASGVAPPLPGLN